MDMNIAVDTLDALAHETRLGVFRLLVQAGPDGLSAGDIAAQMDALQNTMSNHLNKLARAGIITSRRDGRHIIYRANYGALSGLILYLMDDCCGQKAELCEPIAASMNY
jgi:DNA-binding transcriptional ArsR family regulator